MTTKLTTFHLESSNIFSLYTIVEDLLRNGNKENNIFYRQFGNEEYTQLNILELWKEIRAHVIENDLHFSLIPEIKDDQREQILDAAE